MINQHSIQAVEAASFGPHFCRPLYNSYGFSKIPGTVKQLLGVGEGGLPKDCTDGKRYDTVVVFLIDAFGWKFFEEHVDNYPFLKRFVQEGIVSKITSQFPSTTAAHVTCLNSDLEVGQSGVYEWFCYEPRFDRIIAPLLFSFAGDKEAGTLLKTGISLGELYPCETIYEYLQARGIPSTVLQHVSISHSAYSDWVLRGSENFSFANFADGLELLVQKLPKKGYFYIYFGDIDSAAHREGIKGKKLSKAIDECFRGLEDHFWNLLQKTDQRMALIVTADHGMVSIDPKTTYYLNREIPSLETLIQRNRVGELIVPAGSCRDFFLHIQPEKIDTAMTLLCSHLKSRAEVYLTKELIEQGFFGSKQPSSPFLSRVGNIVILPYENNSVWWYEKKRFEQHFNGMHGGLSREEMETIFLFLSKRPLA